MVQILYQQSVVQIRKGFTDIWYLRPLQKMRPTNLSEFVAATAPHSDMMRRTLLAACAAVFAVATVDAFVSPSPLSASRRAALPELRGLAAGRSRVGTGGSARGLHAPLPLQALFGIGEDNIKKVGVIGATGGVGRLAVAYLLEKGASPGCAPRSRPAEFVWRAFGSSIPVPRPAGDVVVRARRPCPLSLSAGYSVRAIVRSKDRAKELLPAEIELKLGDTCDPAFGDGSLTPCLACYICCTALWGHRLNPKPLIEACSSLLSSLPSSLPYLLPSSAFPRPSSLPPLLRPQALSLTRTPTLTLFLPRLFLTLYAHTGLSGAIAGVDALIVATGTTAFPTDKWGPNKVCFEGMGGV